MRLYLIGAGYITRTHMEALRKLEGHERAQVNVCDANPQTLADFIALYPEAKGYADAELMLAAPPEKDDIVIVGTPPSTHFKLAMLGLATGRHVLCEKPLVIKSGEAERLVEEAKRRGVILGCCSTRFNGFAKAQRVRELLSQGAIGTPYKFSFIHRAGRFRPGIEYQPKSRWFLDRSVAGGGILVDWGPYDIASLNELLEPERVEIHSAWTSQPVTSIDPDGVVNNVETHCGAMMRFVLENGRDVWVQYERASCTHGEDFARVELEGTHGAITWNSFYGGTDLTVSTDREGKVLRQTESVAETGEFGPMDNPLRWFVRYLERGNGPAIVNEQAVFHIRILQAVYRCADNREIQIVRRNETHA